MSDEGKALNIEIKAMSAYSRGDLEEAIKLHQEIIELNISPDAKVRSHVSKSFLLSHTGKNEDAVREAELALELDAEAGTHEFEEEDQRALVFPMLDYEWCEQLKALGREGRSDHGIGVAERKLRLLAHIPGNYMPLTQLWLGRKLAAQGDTARAVERLRAGLDAEVPDGENYPDMVERASHPAKKALEMYTDYGALSPQQAFETGIAAEEENATERAIRAYSDALELGIDPTAATEAHLRLFILYTKQGDRDRAVQHGEEALRFDAQRGGRFFLQPIQRDTLFLKLDQRWGQVAEEIGGRDGIAAAREYLLERLTIVSYVQGRYFPFIRFLIAKYSVELGEIQGVREYLTYVQQSETHESDVPGFDAFYDDVRNKAVGLQAGVSQSSRGTNQPQTSAESKGKCWIATAACGPQSEEVVTLCNFRDQHLASGWRLNLVRLYYHTAPPVAALLERYTLLRSMVRQVVVRPMYHFARWRLHNHGQTRRR